MTNKVILQQLSSCIPQSRDFLFDLELCFDQNLILNFVMSRVSKCTIPLNKLLERLITCNIKSVHL